MVPFVQKSTVLGVLGFALFLLAACANQSTTSQPTASAAPDIKAIPITLPISINEVMVAAVDHAAHEIWNAPVKEKAPKNDKD